jgi:GNAT superfamily N-acetyltransferase
MNQEKEIKIRQAAVGDIEDLCRVRNNKALFRGYLEECDGEKAHFLVAELNQKIAGFGLVYLDITQNGKKKSHLPKISDLFVAEEYRNKGVATALIKFKEFLAKQYDHKEIYISIDPAASSGMISLAHKLAYLPLQKQAYPVSAVYYDAHGQPYQKQYFRLDFKKILI